MKYHYQLLRFYFLSQKWMDDNIFLQHGFENFQNFFEAFSFYVENYDKYLLGYHCRLLSMTHKGIQLSRQTFELLMNL